ncbi:MAG: phosphatidylglycerophosphatase A [Desulfobacterales bacterium]|nr:phosphatidylglycerophosphatase A [Desulfobacterales bacterium]MCP4161630.1 phosphatidylglycerophosphatase A [Deltaproteobacteria bacterium]
MKNKIIMFLATGGFIGKIPFAPGTFGTLVGIPLCIALTYAAPLTVQLSMALVILGVWVANEAEKITGTKDPGCVVIDEIAGFVVTMAGVVISPLSIVLGFILFRFFDILKPFPVKYLEDTLPGGAGIMLDDIAAGIMANICLHVILYFV